MSPNDKRIDKRIKVNTIIENQLPGFVAADFPNALEFFKQYYISQEFQGGPSDLINNFDQYLKADNLVPEVIVGKTAITSNVLDDDLTINVTSTKGFPNEYGLLKIDNEIITYTGITETSFTGCIRGFSGITGYNVGISSSLIDVNRESLTFERTSSSSHDNGATVQNLSVLFLQEFYKKLKRTFLPGFEDITLDDDLDVGNFVKFARTFYQSKGIEESIKILFKVLYGVESTVTDLESNLIKPSDAEFIRREVIVADLITPDGDPQNLIGQTIFKSNDLSTNASVSEVEIFTRDGRSYYRMALFVGYSDRDLIQGVFTVDANTKSLHDVNPGASVISVDSTVGFGTTGTLISGSNIIDYESKSINQFFNCSGVNTKINTADNVRINNNIFGYENGDISKKVELRITGVLSELVLSDDINLVNEGETIFIKNIGEKIKNNGLTNKEKFANSWIYNTSSRFEVDIQGGTVLLNTKIDKSSIKVGDLFQILRRNEQVVDGTFIVNDVDLSANRIITGSLGGFTPVPGENYDIRRVVDKATSSGTQIREGNDNIISNVLNVYVDGNTDGYVASNSLPSFNIDQEITRESVVGIASTTIDFSLDGQNPLNGLFNYIQFNFDTNRDLKFTKGDAVVYNAIKDPNSVNNDSVDNIPGLNDGELYYVEPLEETVGTNITRMALYLSRTQIGTASTVQVGLGASLNDLHTFTLQRQNNKLISANKILRKFPLTQNLFTPTNSDENITDIGILINGVELRSPVSEDFVSYGNLTSIEVINPGLEYDVINPPKLSVEASNGGETALVEPVLSGSVKEVFIDPQDFDIKSVENISLVGGNGDGCVLEAITGLRERELLFDSRELNLGGSIDPVDETLTFETKHNLENGDIVYYSSNGNNPIPIADAYGSNTKTGTLANGDEYYVRVVNTSTVRIYNTKNDALSGINTVGFSTESTTGRHIFKTQQKNTITNIKVIEPGTGYQHRKLIVKPSGISTSFDTVNFNNHGFKDGDIVNYSPMVGIGSTMPKSIQGLTTTSSYFVMKVDDNSFKLADAGIGATSRLDYQRGKFVGLNSTGTGYQTFEYPEIKVNIEVGYAGTVTGSFNITPVVTGSFTDVFLYENGSDYGSKILNNVIRPKIDIETGKFGEIKPIISNGKVIDVIVVEQGENYNSVPEIKITSTEGGSGAIVRPVIENGKLVDTVVISTGIGYEELTTRAEIVSRGKNCAFSSNIRNLKLNDNKRFGDYALYPRGDFLSFNVIGCKQDLLEKLQGDTFSKLSGGEFDQILKHSSIIGWAYDGNPIYGPFGYSDPEDINSTVKILETSYVEDISKVFNRPSEFKSGFFVDDYVFDNSGDLDIHNGRFCKTPEFPNGVYAYFTTIDIDSNGFIQGLYPFFIGKTFRSPLILDNYNLNHDFDFNNSNLSRNTYPYNLGEKFADNDFIIESNESIRQGSVVESVSKGEVESFKILNGGENYKVGDLVVFDNTDTNGTGFSAQVSDIVGIGISNIETNLERFEDLVFTWTSDKEVKAKFTPFLNLNDQDFVFVSGLSTSIQNLTDSFKIGVSTSRVGLSKTMNVVVAGNESVEDIFVNKIPNNISIGGSIRVGSGNTINDEILEVLSIYNSQRVIRVRRNQGIAHTFGSNVDLLNDTVLIPVKTKKFESRTNDIVYFNAPQSIGIGTTGIDTPVNYVIGETIKNVSIPDRQIYLPKHPFVTGQKVILNVPDVPNKQLNVSNTDDPNDSDGNFQIPFSGNSQELFVIKKSEDYIGITTVSVGSTAEGLYFNSNASTVTGINTHLYNLSSQFDNVTGDIDKITTKVLTKVASANTTTHELQNNDIVSINVIPNQAVGIGTTTPIFVDYDTEFEKLLINPIQFTSSNVETNRIGIENHGFNTGDKVFYTGDGTLIPNGSYFVYKVNSKYFQLAETLRDLSSDPIRLLPISANTGGNQQRISPINPKISVYKNSKLTFGLSTATLQGFDFKIFYATNTVSKFRATGDLNFTESGQNEYISSLDSTSFNVGTAGTVGFDGASLTLESSPSTPSVLYYGLTKGGFISTADTDVINHSQIIFVDSIYNGDYSIFDVDSESFKISSKLPEFFYYDENNTQTLEYSTKSKHVHGAIKDLDIISNGFNYKKLPVFDRVDSERGINANVIAESTNIGKIKDIRILDIGYEYSADKTLQPEVFIPPVLTIDNLDVINKVEILDGGTDYTSAPNLILFNPLSNEIVDDASLKAITPNQTIADVEIVAPIHGLESVAHRIIALNNSNGIGINSIQSSSGGIVTCFLQTPFNGFLDPQPFAVGDKIFVEGIQRVGEAGIVGLGTAQQGDSGGQIEGDGFNSTDHNFTFFEVTKYTPGSRTELEFSVSGVTTNPGVAKTFQSGYATLVNGKNYPDLRPLQNRGVFQKNEVLSINGQESESTVTEIRDDFIKIDGITDIKKGDRIVGKVTGVSAQVIDVRTNLSKFKIDFSNRQEVGWLNNIGKLNDDTQVIPNNDYYQNLSYTVKSPITWDKFSNSVNSIVHPAGLKNFADTFIESNINVGIGTSPTRSTATIIIDVLSDENRVDAINNFDFVRDFNRLANKTKSLIFSTKKLTNFSKCISNRVLIHDDISSDFSSVGFAANNSIINEIDGKVINYLVQVIDPDSQDAQLSELVVIAKEDDVLLFEKSSDSTGVGEDNIDSNLKLGEFITEITLGGDKNLLFIPEEEFEKDHDIKILKTSYDENITGITTNVIGSVNLTNSNLDVASNTTSTIVEFEKDKFKALQANIYVQDTVTKEINYNEVIVDFDGVDTTIAQIFVDDFDGGTTNSVGIITAKLENDLVKLQIENDGINVIQTLANVVGLGTTTAGIGTHRFLSQGQPLGAERSVRLESTYNSGTGGQITFANLSKSLDSSVKSLVKVSTGQTSAIHQIIGIRDAEDVLVVQYPFVSLGSTTGIGTFTSQIVNDDINLKFVPDAEFTELVEVQAYNQIFYTDVDFDNIPGTLSYGGIEQDVILSTFDGLAGRRANKTKFDLKFEGTPIYSKEFNPSNNVSVSKTDGVFTIPNHFFNTNEELVYKPASSFIGVAATAMSIGSTINSSGITTDILPSTVFAKNIDENKFQLFPTREDVISGSAITFTGIGAGNAHKLSMFNTLSKTIIGLDGVVQQPITFTSLTYDLTTDITGITTQFSLSGIGSISTFDVLKINDEFMKVIEVGFSSTSDGSGEIDDQVNISEGISNVPTVRVERGVLGIAATSHTIYDVVRVHRGAFNIIDSSVHFIDPPKGNTRSRRTDSELPFVKADFSGRTFLRQDYTTNMLFDDISDNFTGITTSYDLKVGGANTSAGIEIGNGVVFINGVFQTPFTNNNIGHNYKILADTTAGVSTIRFTGITSENGQFIVSDSDINQNQIPRGGLIVSLGSTEGLGYAPLVGAKVRAEKNSSGALTNIVGIGTSSGFNLGIQTAVYNNISGIITVTTNEVHGFALNKPNTVKLKDLEFSCVGYSGVTTTFFQDHERPLFLVGIVSDRSFEVQAGPSTIVHTYVGGGNAFEFFEDLNFGSGYRGGSVSIGVTDVAFEHKFVSSGIGSIRKDNYAGDAFTATDAIYESHSGLLTLVIPNHGLQVGDSIGIDTGGLVFKCSKDGFFSNHPYPRAVSKTSFPNSDPFAGTFVSIGATSLDTITINVGAGGGGGTGATVEAIVGVGGTLSFTITNPGSGYVNPEIIIPEPTYENLEVVGISRLGVGPTTDTGENLLLNVGVSAAGTSVGVGATLFAIRDFEISRSGHSFKKGDKFKPVGLVTAAHLTSPIQEFELEVLEIFNDRFSAWQFGEIDAIDNIKILQDGIRTRFPLFFNGELLSFEKDLTDTQSQLIDLDAVLLVFVNGVLQKPGEAYQFEGGTTFTFTEAPSGESQPGINDNDNVVVFFYKGIEGIDVKVQDVVESIKIGDSVRVLANEKLLGITTSQASNRIVKDILNTDLVDTDIYSDAGIDEINEKPIKWIKQKVDININGQLIDKSRSILEPLVFPTAKIIGDFTTDSGTGTGNQDGIFVDNASVFFYENKYNGISVSEVDALVTSGNVGVGAAVTATVNPSGQVSAYTITESGSGYVTAPTIRVSAPVGGGTTANGSTVIDSNGSVTLASPITFGTGYNFENPPECIIESPEFKYEKITRISNFQGYTGIITGITQTTRSGGGPALRFDFHAVTQDSDGEFINAAANQLLVGYPIYIKDTKVGNGLTSVNTGNSDVVGVGVSFLDNIYIVNSVTTNGSKGTIVCNVHTNSASLVSGINTEGFYEGQTGLTTSLGTLSWGRLYGNNTTRSSNPISINVSGLIVDAGLSTFPTIQRKSYDKIGERGHRSSGSIRAILA